MGEWYILYTLLPDINVYYYYLLADAVQVATCVLALRSLCWAPVAYYMKFNWETGRSKLKKRLVQGALFILYIILITPRVFSLTLIAVSSAFSVYLYLFVRFLVMLSHTLVRDTDVDFSSDWGKYQQRFVNVCRALLYVFVDINCTQNHGRFFFSIGVHVIMLIEDVLIIIILLPLLTSDSGKVGDLVFVVTWYGHSALIAGIFCCYPLYSCLAGSKS